MNSELISGIKKNWHGLALCAGLIVAGIVFGFGGGDDANVAEDFSSTDVVAGSEAAVTLDAQIARPFREVSRKEARAQAAIDLYTKQNEESGRGEEEEKNLYRIGNLYYSNVFDYDKAALAYIELIEEYPETDKLQMAYVALADCYFKLEDFDQEMETYRVITQKFPAGSPAHQLASEKLEGKR